MDKEEEILVKRTLDLANKADKSGHPIFSDFLNLNEQSIIESIKGQLSFVDIYYWGGYDMAERKMLCFCPKGMELDREWFTFDCIRVSPLNQKFADKLSHRDFLGALVNTGLERNKLGDIIVCQNQAFFFCHSKLSQFLCQELTRIKHTSVMLSLDNESDINSMVSQNFIIISGSISSLRADSLTALAVKASRSTAEDIISSKRLFVNARLIIKKDAVLKLGDVLSIRGYGKYIIDDIGSPNSKNRMKVSLKAYN